MNQLTVNNTDYSQLRYRASSIELTYPLKWVLISKIILLVSVIFLQGCASLTLRPISEKNKDTTGVYDGQWLGTVISTSGRQQNPGGYATCPSRAGQKYPFIVSDGQIGITNLEDISYINSDGKFRVEIPRVMTVFTDSVPVRTNTMFIISGSLKTKSGEVRQSLGRGASCRSSMRLERI